MNRLTEVQVRKAKSRKRSYKISDGGWMYLLVHHNGSKYWRFNYQIDGQQRTHALGVWPAVGLKEAREKRDQILGAGHDLAWLYPKDQGSTLVADSELKSAISHYLKLKDEEKQIHEKKKDLEVLIKQEVKQHAQVLDNKGRQLLSWKNHDQSYFDSSTFKKDHDELYQQYSKTTTRRVLQEG